MSGIRRVAGAAARLLGALKRTLYRDARPGRVMRWWNRADALLYSSRLPLPGTAAALVVEGRRTGRPVTLPVAIATVDGADYLVAMLGPRANWVRNVEAAQGAAVLRRRGRSSQVRLEIVPPELRGPILRRYVAIAPGARPHVGLGPSAPLAEFARIAAEHPVYLIRGT